MSSHERKSLLAAFGAALKAERKRKGLSQEKLGFECDLDRTYVSGLERGVRNPTLLVVERLAEGLKVQPSELLAAAEAKLKKQRL